MTTHVLQFTNSRTRTAKRPRVSTSSARAIRSRSASTASLGRIKSSGCRRRAAALLETALGHLLQGQLLLSSPRIRLSPNDAANILGISRPLVVHRMDVGDLPFRYIGKHRRTKLKDVLALKTKMDAQRKTMEALAEDAERLRQRYGV